MNWFKWMDYFGIWRNESMPFETRERGRIVWTRDEHGVVWAADASRYEYFRREMGRE